MQYILCYKFTPTSTTATLAYRYTMTHYKILLVVNDMPIKQVQQSDKLLLIHMQESQITLLLIEEKKNERQRVLSCLEAILEATRHELISDEYLYG